MKKQDSSSKPKFNWLWFIQMLNAVLKTIWPFVSKPREQKESGK